MMQVGLLQSCIITASPKAIREWQDEKRAELPGAVFVVQAFGNAQAAELFAKSWLGP
jgi:hypothetical protein